MSPFGDSYKINNDHHIEAQHDWAEGTFLQGGDKGVVFSRTPGKPSYVTAFVEAFPPEELGGGFFRGEGATAAEAETSAWEKWQLSQQCPGHEWEPRGYTNGGGFCKHCKRFGSKVFTGEELGQFCADCGVGTTYDQTKNTDEVDEWYCSEHYFAAKKKRARLLVSLEKDGNLTERQASDLSMLRFMYIVGDDGELTKYPTAFTSAATDTL